MDKKIVVFCPSPFSLITVSVCEMLLKQGYPIEAIVIRKFSAKRFTEEFARDGKRLLKKIWKKLVLREKAYTQEGENIVSFRQKKNLHVKNVKEFKNQGIKLIHCNNLNDKIVEDYLKTLDDKIIVFTGGGIIRSNILNEAGDGIINCHMGILPQYKGMDLPEWALIENQPECIGLTLHFMDSGIDTGNILNKVYISPKPGETVTNLRRRFEPIMVSSIVDTLVGYLSGKYTAQVQEENDFQQYFIMHPKLVNALNEKLSK